MSEMIVKPRYVKFRRESDGGLVYDHENYGYDDATLRSVDEQVIDVLERVDEQEGCDRATLIEEFGPGTVDTLLNVGMLTHA